MSETLRDRRLRYARTILQSRRSTMALLGENSALEGLRVLVLGTAAADTLCALMHTECRKAEARLPEAHVESRSADLVLAPHVTLVTINQVINQAVRALDHYGRIVIAVPPHERDFIDVTIGTLVRSGFEVPHLRSEGDQTTIHALQGEIRSRA